MGDREEGSGGLDLTGSSSTPTVTRVLSSVTLWLFPVVGEAVQTT